MGREEREEVSGGIILSEELSMRLCGSMVRRHALKYTQTGTTCKRTCTHTHTPRTHTHLMAATCRVYVCPSTAMRRRNTERRKALAIVETCRPLSIGTPMRRRLNHVRITRAARRFTRWGVSKERVGCAPPSFDSPPFCVTTPPRTSPALL